MDNNLPPSGTVSTAPTVQARTPFLRRLFSGRVNRKGFILGILTVGLAVAILAMVLFAICSLVFNPTLTTAFLLGMVFIVFLFYAFSLSLRRLHDLNRSGLFLLLFLPGEIGTFFFLVVNFAGAQNVVLLHILQAIPSYVEIVFTVIRWIANVFTVYMILWPGTDAMNKYGAPPSGARLKEVLGFAEPTPQPPVEEVQPQEGETAYTAV